jgi:DNA-binding response OmpR family regulator
MIVSHSILEPSRGSGRLDPADEILVDQDAERVVHGLAGDRADDSADVVAQFVGRRMGVGRHGPHDGQPLGGYLHPVPAQQLIHPVGRVSHIGNPTTNSGMSQILDRSRTIARWGAMHGSPALRIVTAMTANVLVVEDDQLIASSLARVLRSRGYEVDVAATVEASVRSITDHPPDLVLLDLGLPDGDGHEVCDLLVRRHPHIPVIVVTARGDEVSIVDGLEIGAVDYIVKPFRLAELLARVQTHMRFARVHVAGPDGVLAVGELSIDLASRRVKLGESEIALRPKEFDVLVRLARDAGTVVTRERLIDEVWDEHWWGSTKTLDVHINALRRKLGEQPGGPSRIVTVRGVGYRLDGAPHRVLTAGTVGSEHRV